MTEARDGAAQRMLRRADDFQRFEEPANEARDR
jgi:hypothetical protein